MRILHYSVSDGGYVSDWPYYHIYDELRRAGLEIEYFNPVDTIGHTATPAEYGQALLEYLDDPARSGAFDLLFGTITDVRLDTDALREVRRRGIAVVTLSTDDYSHPFRIQKTAAEYDLVWSTVHETRHVLEGYGAKVMVLPFAANPTLFQPGNGPELPQIGFVGLPYGAREWHLARLAKAGLPVVVHGPAPSDMYRDYGKGDTPVGRLTGASLRRAGQSLTFAAGRKCVFAALKRSVLQTGARQVAQDGDKAITYRPGADWDALGAALSASAISLGSIELASTFVLRNPLLFIRLREFEAAMSGAVHLVNRFPELAGYFEEDREMLFYGSNAELEDKARYYLSDKRATARGKIRAAARARAVAQHSWTHRFETLAQTLGLKLR